MSVSWHRFAPPRVISVQDFGNPLLGYRPTFEDPRSWRFDREPDEAMALVRDQIERGRLWMPLNVLELWRDLQSRARQVSVTGPSEQHAVWLGSLDLQKLSRRYEMISGRRLYEVSPRAVRWLTRKVYMAFRTRR